MSPAMVRREKCRRPKPLIVDVMGSQVGVNGSPFTVCFLCSHKDKAQVLQLQSADEGKLLALFLQTMMPCKKQEDSHNNVASALPLITALNRYGSSCPFNHHTACRGENQGRKQHQLVGIHKPLPMNLDST